MAIHFGVAHGVFENEPGLGSALMLVRKLTAQFAKI